MECLFCLNEPGLFQETGETNLLLLWFLIEWVYFLAPLKNNILLRRELWRRKVLSISRYTTWPKTCVQRERDCTRNEKDLRITLSWETGAERISWQEVLLPVGSLDQINGSIQSRLNVEVFAAGHWRRFSHGLICVSMECSGKPARPNMRPHIPIFFYNIFVRSLAE